MSGWISVKDRLPDEYESIFSRFYGTSRWSSAMFKKCSKDVIVAYRRKDSQHVASIAHTIDGKWSLPNALFVEEVTHWMPLPEPPKEESPCSKME